MTELDLRGRDDTLGPGAALRALRKRMGLRLADVSKRSGLPTSTLSKLETGKMTMNYSQLERISRGLDIDIAQLIPRKADAPASLIMGRRSISRAGEGPEIKTKPYTYVYPATDVLNKSINPMIIDVSARSIADFPELMRHPGEEYAYVLEGAIVVHTDLFGPVILNKGDSIYFDGLMGHAYVAADEGPCRVLSICSATHEELSPSAIPHIEHKPRHS